MTLAEIKENNLRCVIKVDSKEEAVELFKIFNPNGYDVNYDYDYLTVNYWKGDGTVCFSVTGNKINGFDTETYYKKNEEQYGKIYRFKDLIVKEGIVGTFKGTPVYANRDSRTIKEVKEEKKMSTKFTFYATEGTRVDKSCNGTIPTMTTNIELSDGNVFDEVTTVRGSATCDKADYDERQGVLEALANAVCGGEFEKRYKKAVKANKDADLWMRTCYYCGKVFDTVEEKVAHDDWHVERKKARRERYLLRKRAKEIAFEEQAQKMAKEMIDAEKGAK